MLGDAQSAYLGQIDSLQSPDRTTHELIRLACSVILRHPPGIKRHAMLAAEFGASWEDVIGTIVLTQPGFGLVPSLEALPHRETGSSRVSPLWHPIPRRTPMATSPSSA